MEAFLDRVKARSGLEVSFRSSETGRLPLPQERELWRIAKEAVTNVERHARASHLSISWHCDGRSAELVVADDGVGFPAGSPTRIDSYGILGMRERAASVGARLEIDSKPGAGTVVRATLAGQEG
jgi:signal transduction histidine kinase